MDGFRVAAAGSIFGSALTLSGVYLPNVIVEQMRLKDFHMLEVFLIGSAGSAVVLLLLERLNIARRNVRSNSSLGALNSSKYDGNILGGALIGTGMALSGACPGTVIIQLAQGIASARWTALGAVLGGTIWAKYGDAIMSAPAAEEPIEEQRISLSQQFNTTPGTMLWIYELMCLSIVALSTLVLPGKQFTTIPTIVGGLLIVASQASSVLLSRTPLGTSGVYEQLGRYVCRFCGLKGVSLPPWPPRNILFALGMMVGSIGLTRHGFTRPVAADATFEVADTAAVIGGIALATGARMAGGCTSGHGISGLSAMSFSSLITVAAMFGSGIVVRTGLDLIVRGSSQAQSRS